MSRKVLCLFKRLSDSFDTIVNLIWRTNTTRYQESDLHLAFIPPLLTTSTYSATFSVLPTSLLLLYFTSSSIVAVSIAKAGHVWVSWPERVSIVYLIANIATGLLLLGNRLAYALAQLTSTKEQRSALPPQTRPPVKNWHLTMPSK